MDSLLASYGSDDEEEQQQTPSDNITTKKPLFAALPLPKFCTSSSSPQQQIRVSDPFSAPPPDRKRPSLFAALPPPSSSTSGKRVVEFRPPLNSKLLDNPDDEDDQRPRKRQPPEVAHGEKLSGLVAVLPRPKNLGTTLGGGASAGGRRSTLEMSSEDAVDNPASVAETGTLETPPPVGISQVSSGIGSYDHYVREDFQTKADAYDSSTVPPASQTEDVYGYNFHSSFIAHETDAAFAPEGHLGVPFYQSQGLSEQNSSSINNKAYEQSIYNGVESKTEDPLTSIMMKEKRRGSKEAPPNLIEVKQADLTATKVREDQLRTTGIAFGPAYQPVSSNKDKPSKLHRRKHQIGSLYFDMKQKEMELLERRAKGTMTKSQTQAKYGW